MIMRPAYIGYIQADGCVVVGEQHYNTDKALPILKKYFNTVIDIQRLIKRGSWESLYDARDRETALKEMRESHSDEYMEEKDGYLIFNYASLKIASIHTYIPDSNHCKQYYNAVMFDSVSSLIDYSLYYLYLFNPKTKQWGALCQAQEYERIRTKLAQLSPKEDYLQMQKRLREKYKWLDYLDGNDGGM